MVCVCEPITDFPNETGVKQSDPTSQRLFSAVIETAVSEIRAEDQGIRTDGQRTDHVRFADDSVLLAVLM